MSELKALKNTAPTLQRVPGMKSIFVGLLAVFALTGCGVGMDDLEGEQAAAGQTADAVMAASTDNSVSAQGEILGPVHKEPLVALPQDPIPVFEGKRTGTNVPRPAK
ncbi:MAG: hypothetical protein H6Q89_2152 [Myxococcaceae bacterium]|nr:hypothetical protein [Myxococcaceae bacterium]